MADTSVLTDEQIAQALEEQESGPAPTDKPKKTKPVAAKGGAFIDRNEKKATKPVRMKALEKEAKQEEKRAKTKRIKEGRKSLEADLEEQKTRYAKEKDSMATKKRSTGRPKKTSGRVVGKRVDDAELAKIVGSYQRKGMTGWSSILKAMRADGVGAQWRRVQQLVQGGKAKAGERAKKATRKKATRKSKATATA
jgi:hypothetical protein